MKITKFVHSCLLAQEGDRTVLFDPGSFTWDKGQFDLELIHELDRIAITHNHADHCEPAFIKALLEKFPSVQIVCNQEVQKTLEMAGIAATFRGDETNCLKPFLSPHESTAPVAQAPSCTGFHFKDLLSHPGDSHSFSETKPILALPFISPWGSIMNGLKLAIRLKPKYVFSIHDWFFHDEAKVWLTNLATDVLVKEGIEFIDLKPGQIHEF